MAELSEEELLALGYTPEQIQAAQPQETSFLDDIANWFSSFGEEEDVSADIQATQEEKLSAEQLQAMGYTQEQIDASLNVKEEDAEKSTFEDIASGVASGLLAIPQGVGELGGSVIDLIFDTDTSRSVTETFEEIRQSADIDPEGTAGEIAEALAQFAIPGLGAAGLVSKVSKASKLAQVGGPASARALLKATAGGQAALRAEMIKQTPAWTARLQQVGAAAAADAVVATDGVTTLGDFFEGGPTQTDKSVGLQGREEAMRRITNKLKLGAESATIVGALPLAGEAVAGVGGITAKGIAEAGELTGASKALQKGLQTTGRFFDNTQFSENELMQKLNENVFRHFRSRGNLPIQAYNSRVETIGDVSAEMELASRNIHQMTRIMEKNVKPKLFHASRATDDELVSNKVYNLVESALANETIQHGKLGNISVRDNLETLISDELTKGGYKGKTDWIGELADSTRQARSHIDDLSERFLGMPGLVKKLEDTIRENMGSYMTRVYRAHTDKNWAKHVMEKRPQLVKEAKDFLQQQAAKNGKTLSEEELTHVVEDILGVRPGKVTGSVDESVLSVLKGAGITQKRQNVPEVIRNLMGEIKDPRSHYAYTVSKMSNYLADRRFFSEMATDGLQKGYVYNSKDDIPRALLNQFEEAQAVAIKQGEDPVTRFGDLATKWVRTDVMQELNRTSLLYNQDRGMFASLYASTFLPLKGMSQYAKTVLSPITQVRNFNTATFFAMAQGNVGRGANVMQSLDTVIDAIRKKPQSAKLEYYREMQRLGIVNTNVQVEEMRRLIDEELALGDPSLLSASKLFGNLDFGRNTLANRIRKIPGVNLAQDMYQGTDDLWKIYNFEFEKTKYMKAGLSEEAAKAKAADIVRNTVPNYSAVPNIIKEARKLPVGNFISFPAEILRTGYNTLKYSVDELASDSAAIREIGARRLMGLTAVTAGISTAVKYGAEELTGVSEEEMDAIKRYFSPEWQKNSVLVPTGRKENGNITYVDFSYMNPYDYLQRPLEAVRNAWIDGTIRDAGFGEKLFKSGVNATAEFIKPFVDPSIMTEKISSAFTGTNPEGRKIWREGDTTGDKMGKSFLYMLDGVMPPFIPLDTTGAPETFARGDFAHAGRLSTAAFAALSDDEKAQYDYRGRKFQLEAELMRLVTGITEQETNIKQSMKYAGFEHSRNLADATNAFTGALTRGGYFTEEEAETAFRTANDMRYRSFAEMHERVKAAELLGKSRSEIIRDLKASKVGDIPSIIRGKFVPYFPGKESIKRINSMPEKGEKNRLPVQRLRGVYRELLNKPLEVTVPDEEPVQVVPTTPVTTAPRQPAQQQSAPVAQTSVTAPASQGIASMQMSQRPYTPAEMSALGLSPTEQAIKEKQQIGRV